MLEIFVKIINSFFVAAAGFYIIKEILQSNQKIYSLKTIIFLLISSLIVTAMHKIEYTGLYAITVFLLNIIIYKYIFDLDFNKSITAASMLMIIMTFGDLIVSMIVSVLYPVDQIRGNIYIFMIPNLLVCIFSCALIRIKVIKSSFQKFYSNIKQKKSLINIFFFILLVICFLLLSYNIYASWDWESNYVTNLIIIVILGIITYIFIDNKNNYNQLSVEYDNLFNYIQNFEDWIEKEQLNRHEYKNQLAVLRTLSKDKNVKNKIDDILEDNINLEGEVVNQLKNLPKGGIKGLMYYKLVIAQKNKIDLTVDVSIKKKSILNKLSEKQIKDLCKLIGIYFDNAIEAASKTRKKRVLVEIYELKDKVNIVFSNTFKKGNDFDNRNKKGVSSKGKGHGNGLYFANKIISHNDWLNEKQEIIDSYYIEKLNILKLED